MYNAIVHFVQNFEQITRTLFDTSRFIEIENVYKRRNDFDVVHVLYETRSGGKFYLVLCAQGVVVRNNRVRWQNVQSLLPKKQTINKKKTTVFRVGLTKEEEKIIQQNREKGKTISEIDNGKFYANRVTIAFYASRTKFLIE